VDRDNDFARQGQRKATFPCLWGSRVRQDFQFFLTRDGKDIIGIGDLEHDETVHVLQVIEHFLGIFRRQRIHAEQPDGRGKNGRPPISDGQVLEPDGFQKIRQRPQVFRLRDVASDMERLQHPME
jgi:hypothetical protein